MVARLAEVEFVVDSSQLERAKRRVQDLRASNDNLTQTNNRTGRSFSDLGKRAARVGTELGKIGALAGGAVAGGLALVVQQNLQAIDQFDKLNSRLGVSVEALTQLQFVAEQNGVSFQNMSNALQRLQRRTSEAAQGSGEAVDAFEELGLNAERLTNLPLDEQFEVVADALNNVGNQADKTRLAMRLFDTEGVALLQTMENGAEGIRQLRQEADELGLTLTNLDAQSVARANDAMNELSNVFVALGRQITVALAPTIEQLADFLRTEFVNNLDQVKSIINDSIDVFRQLGSVAKFLADNIDIVTTAFSALIGLRIGAAFGPWGAAIGLVAGALGGELLPSLNETKTATEQQIEASKELSRQLSSGREMSSQTAQQALEEAIARREAAKATLEQIQNQIQLNQTVTEGMQRPGANVASEMQLQADLVREQIARSEQNIQQLRDQINGANEDAEALEITVSKAVPPAPTTKPDAIRDEASALRERIQALQLNAEQEQRLLEAQRQGEEALRRTETAIRAENEARRLGIELGSERHQQILEAIRAERTAADARNQILEEQRQNERSAQEAAREAERERNERLREREALMRRGESITESVMTVEEQRADRMRELNNLLDKGAINTQTYNRAVSDLNQTLLEESNTAQAGFVRGIQQVKEEVNDLGTLTEDLVVNSFSKLEDSLVSAFTTGKFEAKEFFNAVLADLARLAVRAAIIRPLFSFFGFQQGGVPALEGFAQGGVVSQPTMFPMQGNNVGVMSEFGQDEAIMPLQRTSSGDLGVRAELDGNRRTSQNVTIAPNLNITIEAAGSVISSVDDFKDEIATATGSFVTESIVNELRQGGFLERA